MMRVRSPPVNQGYYTGVCKKGFYAAVGFSGSEFLLVPIYYRHEDSSDVMPSIPHTHLVFQELLDLIMGQSI